MKQQLLYNLRALHALAQYVHWNFSGRGFISVHGYLDEVIETVEDFIDWIAEDIRRDGNIVNASLRDAAIFAKITTPPTERTANIGDVSVLSENTKALIIEIHNTLPEYTPSEQSTITNFTDKLRGQCYWLDSESGE